MSNHATIHILLAASLVLPGVASGATPTAASPAVQAMGEGGQDDAASAYALAQRYSGRTGQAIDWRLATEALRQAAQRGHVQAQSELAFLYYNGSPQLARDPAQAFRWFSQAAEGGSVIAQCMVGDFYRNGTGGAPRRPSEAVRWYRLTAASEARCASRSQYELYRSYADGVGVPKDGQAAVQWLMQAAQNGNPVAQATLGKLYLRGELVPADPELGRRWLIKSREGVAPHDLEPHVHGNEDAGDEQDHDHDDAGHLH